MAEQQGGQGGGQGYTDDDVELLLNETAKRAAAEALKNAPQYQPREQSQPNRQPRGDEENGDELMGVSSKLVKQLQGTVTVFNTLKEFASNPLQKAIETKVGELAAGVIENAFTRPGPPPRKDLIDTILNSQFAFGLGNGLGQRGPELVESLGKTFGREKAEEMIDGVIGQYGKGHGGQSGQSGGNKLGPGTGSGTGPSPGPSSPSPEQKQQTEKELLLSLDPNNPEHVAAYAESQGGIAVDTARKMLMIHQDEFIKQMKNQGSDISQLSTMRGSHAEKIDQSASATSRQGDQRPTQPEPPMRQTDYAPPRQPMQQPVQQQERQQVQQSSQQRQEYPSEMEYTEFQDVSPSPYPSSPGTQYPENPPPGVGIPPGDDIYPGGVSPPGTNIHNEENPSIQDSQQAEMMKQFANDIGKVMGDMVGKIEALNNTVFVLQNELVEIKRKGEPAGSPQKVSQLEDIAPPEDITPLEDATRPEEVVQSEDTTSLEEVVRQQDYPKETVRTPPKYHNIKRSEDFFEENIHDATDFNRDLEEEAKVSAKKFEEIVKEKQPVSVQSSEQLTPFPMTSPDVTMPQPIDSTKLQKEEGSEKQEEGSKKQGEKESEKQEEKVYKKFVKPIKTADIRKNIYTPSFGLNSQSEKSEDNKGTDI